MRLRTRCKGQRWKKSKTCIALQPQQEISTALEQQITLALCSIPGSSVTVV